MVAYPRPWKIDPEKDFFIFDTRGDTHGMVIGQFLYDMRGEYIGFLRGDDYEVYTKAGEWVGNLWPDGRIIRKRTAQRRPLLKDRPPLQPKIRVSARMPLAPISGDLGYDKIDVLDWDDEVFKRVSDLAGDMGEE